MVYLLYFIIGFLGGVTAYFSIFAYYKYAQRKNEKVLPPRRPIGYRLDYE